MQVGPVGVTDNAELAEATARGEELEVQDGNESGQSANAEDTTADETTTEKDATEFAALEQQNMPTDKESQQETAGGDEGKEGNEVSGGEVSTDNNGQSSEKKEDPAFTANAGGAAASERAYGSYFSPHAVVDNVRSGHKYVNKRFEAVTSKTSEVSGSLLEDKKAKQAPVSTTWFYGVENINVTSVSAIIRFISPLMFYHVFSVCADC